jgi:CheY-like chemotaxis protein
VPIVALTAYAMREHRERIGAAGANGLIAKPITSIEALGRELAAYVGPRRAPAARAAETAVDACDPVIDLAVFEALCEAVGKETMAELIDKVITDLETAQRELAAALDSLDRAQIRSASHILISVAGALGALRLQGCARALNTVAHTDATDCIVDGVRRCIAEIDAALAFARERRAAG